MANQFADIIKVNGNAQRKSPKEIFRKYLSWYPLFIGCMAICVGLGYFYIRYAVPEYIASTSINVKGETNKSTNIANQQNDLINNIMNGGHAVINLDNEMARLRSARLMTRVVTNSDLNIFYYLDGKLVKSDIYHDAPFRLLPKDIQDSIHVLTMTLSNLSGIGGILSYTGDEGSKKLAVKWNKIFTVQHNSYMLTPVNSDFNVIARYGIEWKPYSNTVYALLKKLNVSTIGKTSNIQLTINVENPKRGEDILNKMVNEFIAMNLEDQNRAAQDKIYFIEQRLGNVTGELKGAEDTIANYQGKTMLFNGINTTAQYGEPLEVTNRAIAELKNQLQVLDLIKQYITSADFQDKLVPSTLGINDQMLVGLVQKYNDAQLAKQRLSQQLTTNSPQLKDLNNQITVLKSSILDNLASLGKNLQLQLSGMQQQNHSFRSNVATLPAKEKKLQEITREKNIKENLYLYLLQKREETAMSRTTTSIYEQIDLATSRGPVSPDKKATIIYAVLLGLVLPVLIIFIRDATIDKVMDRNDITQHIKLPVLGEISYIKKLNSVFPTVKPGVLNEQFRLIKTTLLLQHSQLKKQVILVTSYMHNEGKSFVSMNLAASMAKSGKKVAMLDFDLRKPAMTNMPLFKGKGLSDYLSGGVRLSETERIIKEVDGLHIYPAGEMVTDVGDLLLEEKLVVLFDQLKAEYDIIIINTAPIGMVSDALVLSQYCNRVLFVVRYGQTTKRDLNALQELIDKDHYNEAAVVFNGLKSKSDKLYGSYSSYNKPVKTKTLTII